MEIDKITLNDLSIFNAEEEFSIFNKLNLTRTIAGREQLRYNLNTPLHSIEEIEGIQKTIQTIAAQCTKWPMQISNGTLMVVETFYDATVDDIPSGSSAFAAFNYKLLHGPDFSLVKYSAGHCFDFIKGMQLMVENFLSDDTPAPLKKILQQIEKNVDKDQFKIVRKNSKSTQLKTGELLHLAHFLRYRYRQNIKELLQMYAQLDAWYGMAEAVKKYNLTFPEFVVSNEPVLTTKGLYHLLLDKPVTYDVSLNPRQNFLFLTGANMAGKSTFIKSVGIAVFLAHAGLGIPATQMQLTFFDGLLSNINVVDNISKGESYFYNEVQRIKATVTKVTDGRKWLILIDELFKGTNVQDAMKCSSTVIEGLLKIKNSLFILSTHLYEIGEDLKKYPNINFKYFETAVQDDQLYFSYQLKDGVSNDRLGYLILKREGVVDLLEGL
ncbi:MAG: DNA mismatch repair protein MutS [Chitinophagaceae bacterium]|nr:DNA mismatch repair protein MutS [Chitinophagaceae bacterium]